MSFDFNTLITDRTNADVSALSTLLSKKLETWTPEELEQFNNGMLKGGYWWTDLNRVTACMEYLDEELRSLGYESGYVPVVVHETQEPEKPLLPDGYTQLEYIESTGTQWLDTKSQINSETKIQCLCEIATTKNEQNDSTMFFGCDPVECYWFDGVFVIRVPTEYSSPEGWGIGDKVLIEISQLGTKYSVNGGDEKTLQANLKSVTTQKTIKIFSLDRESYNYFSKIRVISFKVYSGDVLEKEFVPCRNESGEIGLYDVVSSEFYSNSGTGSFIAGPDAPAKPIPEPLDPYTWYKEDSPKIEQLQQYIDNVDSIRSSFDGLKNAPDAPTSPRKITVEVANNIEKILLAVETAIQQTVKGMARSNSFTFWSGNRPFTTAESNKGRDWASLDAMNTGWRNWQLATWYLLLYGNLKAEGDVV